MSSNATEYVDTSLTTGIQSAEMIEAEPYGFRVTWISWDSGFRGTALRIGDRVIGVDGFRYDRAARASFSPKAIGQYSEDQHWASVGAQDGTRTILLVYREGEDETLEIAGTVRAKRVWTDAQGRRIIGPGGPQEFASDGFYGGWSGWYEQLVNWQVSVLDGGWLQDSFNNRFLLAQFLEEGPRVEFLQQNYSGPFAQTVKADWESVVECLRGTRYEVTNADLAYRHGAEAREQEIAEAAKAARASFLAAHHSELIEPFPAIDPIRGDRSAVAGRLVCLPPLGNRDWIAEAGHGWMVATGGGDGLYLVDMEAPAMRRVMLARYRYQKSVTPQLTETYEIVGRIGPDPKMIIADGCSYIGLVVEPVAVMIGEQLFVEVGGSVAEPPFAGEETLHHAGAIEIREDISPAEVMQAFVQAIKLGEEEIWKGLFATWEALPWDEGRIEYRPYSPPSAPTLSSEWMRARQRILERVYDVRVVRTRPARVLMTGREFDGAPTIEEVVVEVDHIGVFDGEYRSFKDIEVHRVWTLQRVDAGPWRITSVQGI